MRKGVVLAGFISATFWGVMANGAVPTGLTYPIVDTGQGGCFGGNGPLRCPRMNTDFAGQDAQYVGLTPNYQDNGDGTVSDLATGLMWQKSPASSKKNQAGAERYAQNLSLGGHNDWRLPTIKELFSIADFNGNMRTRTPYINTIFDFQYPVSTQNSSGRPGQRDMDAQYASSTRYLGTTMGRDESAFGFNFADGRIKSYPLRASRYVRAVRGNPEYGKNRYQKNGDGTITDAATGLIWLQADSGEPMNWRQALEYAKKSRAAGQSDWRLPNVKELQSIVDYSRAPDSRNLSRRSAAIDPLFKLTQSESWFWSSTTHIENQFGYYVAFGQSFSAKKRAGKQINAHGAGAVRSDPKSGDASHWPNGLGPQADEIRVNNYVRLVRAGGVEYQANGQPELSSSVAVSLRSKPPQQRQNRSGTSFIGRLDSNGDGKVSKSEFDGPSRHFSHMDRDGDGYLDSSEAPTGPPPGRRASRGEPGALSRGGFN